MSFKVSIKKKPRKLEPEVKRLKDLQKAPNDVLVGLPKGSLPYPDGTSVISVGVKHEFGSPAEHIPERSFLRSTIKEKREKYKVFMSKLMEKVANGGITELEAFRLLGQSLEKDVKQKITDIKTPPLKYRIGNPLVDTGHMRQSIRYEIRKKNAD